MKKEYKKPEIFVEDFVLANNIASNCNSAANHSDGYTCYYDDGSGWGNTFFDGNAACDAPVAEDYDQVCYNTPNGNTMIFSN